MATTHDHRPKAPRPPEKSKYAGLRKAALVIGVLAVIPAIFFIILATQPAAPATSGTAGAAGAAAPVSFAVGNPGIGQKAPPFSLPSTTGGTVNLSDYQGQSVLLFFHEGIGCQPCWDQIRDLDAATAKIKAAGIDKVLTITSGPVDVIAQKMADDKLKAVALVDSKLAVSVTYETNKYGMMGDTRNGHSFILVGPTGNIEYRADYGGPPNYSMYVPLDQLFSDIKAARAGK